jgi:surfactin synthase thioesterase subunit
MNATVRLFCLPYSGSSASVYASWRRKLPAWIEVVPLELPGRGWRAAEALEGTMGGLVGRLLPEVLRSLRRPYAFFGHSLGAVVAYELACELLVHHGEAPSLLFVSAASAPSRRDGGPLGALDTDADLVSELRRLKGTPEAVLQNEELLRLVLPVVRADFGVSAAYEYRPRPKLRTPIQAIVGAGDPATAEIERTRAWAQHTSGPFALARVPGDHFFLHTHERELLELITRRLAPLAPALRSLSAGSP